jgi:hypothetical protein
LPNPFAFRGAIERFSRVQGVYNRAAAGSWSARPGNSIASTNLLRTTSGGIVAEHPVADWSLSLRRLCKLVELVGQLFY